VARLAVQQCVPVLPVAMVGTREAQPIGQAMPNVFRPITVRIGRPLTFDHVRDRADDPMILRQVTDEIMFELRNLSGQEYVDQYAKRRDPEALPPPEPTPVLAGPPMAAQPDGGLAVEPAAAAT
jgi:1-acyl-sn-glycerol-3-phosphate acyltransferase